MSKPVYAPLDSAEVQNAIVKASMSDEFFSVLDVLTSQGKGCPAIRGTQVNSDLCLLQALQNALGWTIGYEVRPTPDIRAVKERDRLNILLRYRQNADTESNPKVSMLDYLMDTIFAVPMKTVGPDVVIPQFRDLEGELVDASWVEADWKQFHDQVNRRGRPPPVFLPNRYPYVMPERPEATVDCSEFQRRGQHWVLWYFHFPEEGVPDPSDVQIESDVRAAFEHLSAERGFAAIDYIWYRNPFLSTPEVFHVQVFWVVPL